MTIPSSALKDVCVTCVCMYAQALPQQGPNERMACPDCLSVCQPPLLRPANEGSGNISFCLPPMNHTSYPYLFLGVETGI